MVGGGKSRQLGTLYPLKIHINSESVMLIIVF